MQPEPEFQAEFSAPAIPHSREAEEAVIGSVLINPESFYEVEHVIAGDDFYIHRHRMIWGAIVSLVAAGKDVDLLTVADDLERTGQLAEIGGPAFLTSLVNQVPTSLNAVSYATIIEEKAIRRKMIKEATALAQLAYSSSLIEDVLRKREKLVNGPALASSGIDDTQDSDEASLDLMRKIIGKIPTGVKSYFPLFDAPDSLGGFPIGGTLLIGDSSFGKCLAKGTNVVMFDGRIIAVEDVRLGDLLMGVDSLPRTVTHLSHGYDQMFRVKQVYGKDYVVNGKHVLSLKRSTNKNGHAHGDIENVSIGDILKKQAYYQTHYKNYKIGVEFPAIDIPLEPYFLGLWLGDGSSAKSEITNPDKEVIEYIHAYAFRLGLGVHTYVNTSGCPSHRITDGRHGRYSKRFNVLTALRSVGVLNNKHIPEVYLCNSKENRLALLAGLLDSDGYLLARSPHSYEITQKNKRLAYDIKRLADSLGFRTSIVEKIARSQNGTECLVHRMRISGNVDQIPMRIERKKAVAWPSYEDWQISGFKVEPVGVGEYYGFTLDGDGLFLLEDYTVTHNSAFCLQICEQVALGGSVALYCGLESTNDAMVMRRVGGRSGVEPKKVRTASLTPTEEQAIVNEIVGNYQGVYGGRLKFNSRANTIQVVERAIRKHKPKFVVIDQISQITDQPSTNPTLNLLSNFTRLKALGNKYDCAVLVVHAISPDESKLFFAKNAKSSNGKTQKNSVPSVNSIPWASQMKFLADVMLILVPDVNQVLANATVYDLIIWIMKDRDGARFMPTRWDYDLKNQWFTDKPANQQTANRPGLNQPAQVVMPVPYSDPDYPMFDQPDEDEDE